MAEPTEDDKRRPLAGRIREQLAEGVTGAAFAFFAATLFILAAQSLFYLKEGVWPKWVLFYFVNSVLPSPFLDWLVFPQAWHGLHKIVAWVFFGSPLALDTLVLALILLWGATKIDDG